MASTEFFLGCLVNVSSLVLTSETKLDEPIKVLFKCVRKLSAFLVSLWWRC
ncbi:hypothetical protein VAE151_560529 [Vibrio aestuarianus]|uniref:Uncharacterized protein n=1 Tax=Vibrio aestuarianus TaxID=28171 RepID=A0ABM9FS91_9VIBR|nr:hypothetical protein VAE032_271169 [Vibrio aestuarianus]CAH8207071.1 hypothetical protein VAE128_461175 [Vibrio aestuarianus]CAH8207655.1 hypothetical protein VAE115_321172 [Vibrio aestuarianus]CAH8217285.1 hypothetical protein VAE016_371171 [Vibrio aestuarianus]CAH8218899.1 hypothetical protein VAE151_560529 [Vibrio aestuarianus]